MKSRFRVLDVVLAAAIALIVVVPAAHADSMNEVVVAHRGAKMSKYAEGTLPAYRFAVQTVPTSWMPMFAGRRLVPIATRSGP